ncbi:hypothetical protein COCC4DRAFT_159884, partial [Bipolaris maydis ATCC 48331]|uniref:Uncharacterized protein n=2 Tax=Cochliobolus heterostrophus TaxID=5016 RepID=M2SYN4_COCH5
MIWTEGMGREHTKDYGDMQYCETLFLVCAFYSKKHRTSIWRLSSAIATRTNIAHSRDRNSVGASMRRRWRQRIPIFKKKVAANTSSGDFWATMRLGRLFDCGRSETGLLLLFVGARKTRSGW